jgi:hypothetical protein
MLAYADIMLAIPKFAFDSGGVLGMQRITLKLRDGSTQKFALRQSDYIRK